MNLLLMVWRNLWRNWKRTVITMAAVMVAVLLSTIMSSMQEGTYVKMIDNVVKFYSGYLQVFNNGYWESRSIDDAYAPPPQMNTEFYKKYNVTEYTPRLESYTLLAYNDNTKGSALIGIDPVNENKVTLLKRWLSSGSYLADYDDGILLAVNLAKNLKVEVGDTLTLISQGYHGESAAGLFPVRGILTFPSPQLNNYAAYITIDKAREYFSAPGMVTSTVLLVEDYLKVDEIKHNLGAALSSQHTVLTWADMQPELVQMIDGDRAGGKIMKIILYLVVGFGILGTVIMMMSERKKEIGITIAVGMQKYRMATMLFTETVCMGLIGVVLGFLFSLPLIYYFEQNPILLTGKIATAYENFGIEPVLYFSLSLDIFLEQVITVFILTFVVAFFPVSKIFRLKILQAIRS